MMRFTQIHTVSGRLLLLFSALILSLPSCQNNFPSVAGPHLRIGLGANPETLDPHLSVGGPDEQIILNLFEGLTEYDPATALPIPALATRWEVNADATEYSFTLRPDARWSNNDPVTAHDFVYSWRRILDPATAAPLASMLYPIRYARAFNQQQVRLRHRLTGEFLKTASGRHQLFSSPEDIPPDVDIQQYDVSPVTAEDIGVEALDDYVLHVTLEHPTAYFLSLTPHWTYRPVHRATIEHWDREWTDPEHIVVNGPFTVAQWRPTDKLRIGKNQTYRAASEVQIEQATFYLTTDSQALLNLYRTGQIDTLVTGLLPLASIDRLRQRRDYVSGPYLALYYYMLNTRRPPLDNKQVRYALNWSLDRNQLCSQLLRAGQQPARNLTPSDFGGLYPRPEGPAFDAVRAQRLMRQAGYPDGLGLHLRLTFNVLDLNRLIAEAVQAQWKKVFPEIQIELLQLEWQVYLQAMKQKDFDMIRRNWAADYPDPFNFLELMLSNNSNNYTGWANPEYDRLVVEANARADPVARQSMLAEAERLVLGDLPFIPIYEGVTFFLTKPYVRGWSSNILDKHPLKFVSLEASGRRD